MSRTVLPKNAKLIPPQAERVFKGIIYDVYHWQQQTYDGSFKTYEMLKRPDTVKVIAVKDDKIVILDQEQPGDKPYYDLPGGRHDEESENELTAAKRETREETGMSFKSWKLLQVKQPFSKIEHLVYIFLAYDFDTQTEPQLDSGERIEVKLISIDEVKQLLEDPKNRWLPTDIFESVESVDELLNLPEYKVSAHLN